MSAQIGFAIVALLFVMVALFLIPYFVEQKRRNRGEDSWLPAHYEEEERNYVIQRTNLKSRLLAFRQCGAPAGIVHIWDELLKLVTSRVEVLSNEIIQIKRRAATIEELNPYAHKLLVYLLGQKLSVLQEKVVLMNEGEWGKLKQLIANGQNTPLTQARYEEVELEYRQLCLAAEQTKQELANIPEPAY